MYVQLLMDYLNPETSNGDSHAYFLQVIISQSFLKELILNVFLTMKL